MSPETTSESESDSGSESSSSSSSSANLCMKAFSHLGCVSYLLRSPAISREKPSALLPKTSPPKNLKRVKASPGSSSSSSTSSGSESDDEANSDAENYKIPNMVAKAKHLKAEKKASIAKSTSKTIKAKTLSTNPSTSSEGSDSSSTSSSEDNEQPVKKRRTDAQGTSVAVSLENKTPKAAVAPTSSTHVNGSTSRNFTEGSGATAALPSSSGGNNEGNNKRKKEPRQRNAPFQRIKVDGVAFEDERLKDNSFAGLVRTISRLITMMTRYHIIQLTAAT